MTRQTPNELELKLINAAEQGTELDCGEIDLSELNSTTDADRVIHAEVIQGLLTRRYGKDLHPHGIRVRYARIVGSTDAGQPDPSFEFNSLTFPVGVKFEHCWLDHPVFAHDARLPWLHLDDCTIPYFQADRIRVDGSIYLRGLTSDNGDHLGAVRLLGAHIGRNLELDRAVLRNANGPAFHAEGIQVDRALRFRAACLKADCDTGAIQLVNAQVRGDLWLDGTHIENKNGPALNGEGLQVGGSLLLCSGFIATAESNELATIHLMSARIGSRLDFSAGRDHTGHLWDTRRRRLEQKVAVIKNQTGNARGNHLTLDLGCASTNELRLPAETVCANQPPPQDKKWRCPVNNKIIVVGLKYSMLSRESTHEYWQHWLADHTDDFDAEPYQHLAKTLRDSGRTNDARDLLIALEDTRYQQGKTNRQFRHASAAWHWAKRTFVGHGYRPGRALLGLLIVFAVTWALL